MSETGERHLVGVWNPSYTKDAMDLHLQVLLANIAACREGKLAEEEVFVWWGKVRSKNRVHRLPHIEEILAMNDGLADEEHRELHLYLTDYRSLYVGHVYEITEQDVTADERAHVPDYYLDQGLRCDCWFRLGDIHRLVPDDTVGVIAELKKLQNVHYSDMPVSLYGGMVDLPLVVTRKDAEHFFDPAVRDPLTEGEYWARFDSERTGQGEMERDLRENLFGNDVWNALEPASRTFIATAEKIFREHRSDAGFDFGPVVGNFSKAMEVACNAVLWRVTGDLPQSCRQVTHGKEVIDLNNRHHLTLGQLRRVLDGPRVLKEKLARLLANAEWLTATLPTVLGDLARVRNPGVHRVAVERETIAPIRDALMGIGSTGVFNELAKVRPKTTR